MPSSRLFSIFTAFFYVFWVFFGSLTSLPLYGKMGKHAHAESFPTVSGLRIGTHPGKTRLVLDLSGEVPFRAFALEGAPRLVVDMPTLAFNPELYPLAPPVKTIRISALEGGISRLVFDLEKPSKILNAFFLPGQKGERARFVIDFASAATGFDFAGAPVFGTLKPTQPSVTLPLKSARGLSTTLSPPSSGIEEQRAIFDPNAAYSPAAHAQKALAKGEGIQKNSQENRTEGPSSYRMPPPPPTPKNGTTNKRIIVIDPGHGGEDPGAIGANGSREKDITLAVAKELARQLEATGRYKVHLTRSSDAFIKLHERVAIARRAKAELFVSLHADSIDKKDVRGASIYTISDKASDAQTEKLAARENRADLIAGVDLTHEDKDVANILIDLTMRDTMNQSKFFANTMVRQADSDGLDLLERPHRYAGFAVLKAPDTPSVLIEMGYMSNPSEVSKLNSNAYRRRIAQSILAGITSYFQKMERVVEK